MVNATPTATAKAGGRKQSIQVIARAASILRTLEDQPDGLSLGQIAQRVGLARSTVQRIVDALSAEQLLIAATPASGVRLGPALIRLAASANVEFDQLTRPILVELSQSIGETVDLSVLKGHSAVFTDQVQGAHRLRAVSAIGETFPLHCTANGKALMGVVNKQQLARLLRAPRQKYTAATLTRAADLEAQLTDIRRTKIAFDLEEYTEGICAVGTAFIDPLGRAVALSIPVPTTRFRKNKTRLAARLLEARARIIASLGGS
jgi:DNA-binding IclR family transcriptional regulator